MTLLPGDWPPALRAVIRGAASGAEAEARAAFYLAVLGAEAGGAGPEDLALAGLVMRASGLMSAERVARRLVDTAREVEAGERAKFELGDSNLIFANQRELATADAELVLLDAIAAAHRARIDVAWAAGDLTSP